MKENHTQMYQAFVQKLGLPKNNHSNENDVSREYRTHFINKFGVTEDNFKEAVAALSARELLGQILALGSVLAMTAFSFFEPEWEKSYFGYSENAPVYVMLNP